MLACPKCQTPFEQDSVDLSLGVAYCGSCGHVAELKLGGESTSAPERSPPAPPVERRPATRPMPPRPPGWQEARDGRTLVLSNTWRSADLFFMVFFTAFWDGILGFMFVMMLAEGDGDAWFILAMPHTWIGIGLAYYVAASLLNRTTIRADRGGFSISHGPVPWFGGRRLEQRDLDQFYVVRSNVRVNRQARWNLQVVDASGLGVTVLRWAKTLEEARWLEYRLEEHLGIENRHVPGEV